MKSDFDQFAELIAQMKSGRITRAHLQHLIEDPDRYSSNSRWVARKTFQTRINYDLGLGGLILGAMQIGGVDPQIDGDRFPVLRRSARTASFELYDFDEEVTGEMAERKIRQSGYQPEGFPELLAFAAQYPNEQLLRPIAQLKDRWNDSNNQAFFIRITSLEERDDKRYLATRLFGKEFPLRFRFLVSRVKAGSK